MDYQSKTIFIREANYMQTEIAHLQYAVPFQRIIVKSDYGKPDKLDPDKAMYADD